MISKNRVYHDVRCLSTDVKPIDDIINGSVLTEIDTGKTYLFDGLAKQWHEVESSGSGTSVSPIPTSTIHEITGMGE